MEDLLSPLLSSFPVLYCNSLVAWIPPDEMHDQTTVGFLLILVLPYSAPYVLDWRVLNATTAGFLFTMHCLPYADL